MSNEVKPTPSGMHILTVRMPAAMIGELHREAVLRGIPASELVREAVAWKRVAMLPMPAPANPGNCFFTTGQRLL